MAAPRALLLTACLVLAACGEAGGGAPDGPDVTGEWQLTEGTADGATLPPSGATLVLGDGEASGISFCNHYSGAYRLDGDAVTFEGLGGTEMGCDPDVMAAESAFLAALGSVGTAAVDGDELVLSGDGVRLRFTPVAAVPDSPLEGTRWVLESVVDGETVASTVGEPAVLALQPDQRASASTGCRSITGIWLIEDGGLVIDDLLGGGEECPADVEQQDAHVTAVLRSGPTVQIREDQLTLTAADGRGLVYRAED